MFGKPPVVTKDWDDMYFYEKLRHLADKTADFVIGKVNWWMPSVGVGMVLSVLLLGGPEAPAQGLGLVYQSMNPIVRGPPFATPPQPSSGAPPEEQEEEF